MDSASLYAFVKAVHVGCAMVSIGGFALRGLLMLSGSPWLHRPFARFAPHVIDTLLLASALWLAWRLAQYPFVQPWLTAKLLALLGYIVLGSVALKRGRTRAVRAAAYVGALGMAAYIVSVALARDPAGLAALVAR